MTNNSADEFFTWLGKCITAWAQVEEHLFEICVHSLGATRHRVAIVYYRTPTLRARLDLTDELFALSCHSAIRRIVVTITPTQKNGRNYAAKLESFYPSATA